MDLILLWLLGGLFFLPFGGTFATTETEVAPLPSAEVAIQVSGSFGSRQEEAQRLGRLLRPKTEGRSAHFYAIVSRDTVDADFAQNRQRFLAEQGYAYRIVDAEDLPA